MASQLAQTLTNFRQTMPQSGLAQGAENYFKVKERKENREIKDLEKAQIRQETADKKFDSFMQAVAGPVSAASTPDKWASAQDSGMIPKELKYEMREPLLFKYYGDKALNVKEVGDPGSGTGTRFVYPWDAPGQPGKPKSGTEVTVGPEGGVTFRQGVGVTSKLDKTNKRKIQEKAFNLGEANARFKSMRNAFDPKLLTAQSKLKAKFATVKNWLDVDLSHEEKLLVENTTRMSRRTNESLALFIKDISGAAVSEQEAQRLSKVMPKIDDSPIEYATKLEDVMEMTEWALWRHNYALKNGLDPLKTGVDLYEVEDLVERQGEKIELKIRQANPGIDENSVNSMVAQELQALFGSE